MSSDRTPILNLADAPQHSSGHGEHFACSISELAGPLGARSIGANVTRVPPGKAAFPIHHHHANEEHFLVLSDYIVHPAGGPEVAHQLVNTGDEDLVYLAISTLVLPDVVGYPDSGKTGVRARAGQEPGTRFLVKDDDKKQVGYWDDEDGRHVRALLER
jgi:uncharacterized cupin superfamily protein